MKSFTTRAFRVVFDDEGSTAVTSSGTGLSYLDRLDIGALRRNGEPVGLERGPLVVDVDEVEQRWTAVGVAELEIRHSFVGTWRTRVVLGNLAGSAWTATLRFAVHPGPGCRVWTLGVGSAGVVALLPEGADTPILYARSSAPAVLVAAFDGPTTDEDPSAGLDLGSYVIGAAERLVLTWDWSTARHPRQLTAELSAALPAVPRWSCVAVGQEIWLPTDPDTALVVPDEVETTDLGDRHALSAAEPGRHRVELRSARGSTVLELSWATPLQDFLADVAERVLQVPAGPAGVVRLPDLASALVVQRMARTAGFPAAATAADALDQFTARLADDAPEPALRAVYLAGEYDRLGDPDLITRAGELVAGIGTPVPGLGLAVVRTAVASVLAGRPPGPGPRLSPGTRPEEPAEAELLLSTRPPDQLVSDPAVLSLLHRLAIDVRAGLPGRLPAHSPLDRIAHTLTVLRMVPDALGPWWTGRFGCSVGELVDARALEVVERLGPDVPISPAHAWLALGS